MATNLDFGAIPPSSLNQTVAKSDRSCGSAAFLICSRLDPKSTSRDEAAATRCLRLAFRGFDRSRRVESADDTRRSLTHRWPIASASLRGLVRKTYLATMRGPVAVGAHTPHRR